MKQPQKTIIINWKFPKKYKNTWSVCGEKYYKVICINTRSEKEFLKSIEGYNSKKLLVLLHQNEPNKAVKPENLSLVKGLSDKNKKVMPFLGGSGEVYYKKGNGLLDPSGNKLFPNCIKDNCITKENFDIVWNGYWNKRNLENQKNKTINLWFPLLVHIMGLCDLKEEDKQRYYRKIKVSINDNYIKMLTDDLEKISEEMIAAGFKISLEIPIKVLEVFAKDDGYKDISDDLLNDFTDWLNEMNNESNNPK